MVWTTKDVWRYTPDMISHISFAVADLERSAAFYDAVLATLGYVRVWSTSDAVGYGLPGGQDTFAIKAREVEVMAPSPGFHVAFAASNRTAVQAFHSAALECGGQDNGAPGLRERYGPNYYAAFLVDPDGYRVEAKSLR